MTREEKIIQFFRKHSNCIRWCEADYCGCVGCINGGRFFAWLDEHSDEPPITKEEFLRHESCVQNPEPQSIDVNFKYF